MSSTSLVPRREMWDSRQTILKFQSGGEPDGEEEDPLTLTVPAAYDKFLLPQQHLNSAANREKFDRALDHWREFDAAITVGEMEGNDLRFLEFQTWLASVKKLAAVSVNGTCGYIGRIFKRLGPRDGRNKQGQGIIRWVPFVAPLYVPPKPKYPPSIRQLARFYEASGAATWPENRQLPAPLWWRTLDVFSLTYGPRTSDFVPLKKKGSGLAWSSIRREPRCPIAELDVECEHGWIVFTPAKTRKKLPELVLPMTAVVRRHVDALPGGRAPGSLLLPCTTHYEDFLAERKKIEKAAGLERSITQQAVRRTCQCSWDAVADFLGDFFVGHAPKSVAAKFYREPRIVLLQPDAKGEKLIDRFPYPEAMLSGP
jgi:hypothetical protein